MIQYLQINCKFLIGEGELVDRRNAILVVLDKNRLMNFLKCLNFKNVKLIAVLMEGVNGKFIVVNNAQIPIFSFAMIESILDQLKNALWLICGSENGVSDIYKTKKFLINNGVVEDNIVNFDIWSYLSRTWRANVCFIEKNPVDYFVTGISYSEVGFNLEYISGVRGVNLSCSNQDLRQGYLTAKYVFEHTKPGTIKFVFIGLAPYSLRYDNIESFTVCPRNLQYIFTLKNSQDDSVHGKLLQLLINDDVKKIFSTVTEQEADPDLNRFKNSINQEFSPKALITWEDELKNLTKTFYPETVKKNLKILEDYIKLCLENGAKPIGVTFPFAPAMRKNYDEKLLLTFRMAMNQLEKIYDFTFIDLFDLKLDYSNFYNMAHLNVKGSILATTALNFKLYERNIFSMNSFNATNYFTLDILAHILDKDSYNSLVNKIFNNTVEKIKRKDTIKIGFVLYDASMWCGDEIYNLFAQNPRYELTIFLCLRQDKTTTEKVVEDFYHGVEQFRNKGLNVIGITDTNTVVPKQDVLMFLTPYLEVLPRAFQLSVLTTETLMTYIPYAMSTGYDAQYVTHLIGKCCWKTFRESEFALSEAKKAGSTGMSREAYSGHPKMDVFFDSSKKFQFNWKMAQPNAKKIIYAPHWSINERGVKYSTFNYNYQFMYDYAKNHPEISWVFKPHPNLLFSAVEEGVFPSAEAFKEYLEKWNDLPNAKVVTGAYYQEIFATSDGMILDSDSFIVEYQYTHKPMIFLTRDTQKFNALGNELMKILYRVDGRDFEGINKLMQKVFTHDNDIMFDARMNFFNEYLDYEKVNKMSASQYIFKSISDEFIWKEQ